MDCRALDGRALAVAAVLFSHRHAVCWGWCVVLAAGVGSRETACWQGTRNLLLLGTYLIVIIVEPVATTCKQHLLQEKVHAGRRFGHGCGRSLRGGSRCKAMGPWPAAKPAATSRSGGVGGARGSQGPWLQQRRRATAGSPKHVAGMTALVPIASAPGQRPAPLTIPAADHPAPGAGGHTGLLSTQPS